MSIYTERISKYLGGEMTTTERREFEADLYKDSELKEEYQLTILAKEVLIGEPDLERILNDPGLKDVEADAWMIANTPIPGQNSSESKNASKNLSGKASPNPFKIPAWVALAAAILIAALLLFELYFIPRYTAKIFLTHNESVDPSGFTNPDLPPEILADFQTALHYYETEEYELAAAAFRSIQSYGYENPEVLLFLGLSEMERGETDTALVIFKEISVTEGPHTEYASFYSGLCYIRLGDPRAAFLYLTEITGLSKHLDKSTQKLLRRVNLINTLQFKQLRKEMSEDEEPRGILGPTQKGILLLFVIYVVLFPTIAFVDIIRGRFKNNRDKLWLAILMIPFIGPLLYFLIGRKERMKKKRK